VSGRRGEARRDDEDGDGDDGDDDGSLAAPSCLNVYRSKHGPPDASHNRSPGSFPLLEQREANRQERIKMPCCICIRIIIIA
jgi:hypothetical protein